MTSKSFDSGELLNRLPHKPGVYRMVDAAGDVLYVGKARDLRKRVGSYFQRPADNAKTLAMLRLVQDVQITVTSNETEALLLENNLIKSLKPRFNITLRDDKSYPYILITTADTFPRLAFHRGAHREPGRYFGPFPSAFSARDTLKVMQKIFPVRQCEDTFFKNRSRPCLQYQIKRCTAPCVGLVSQQQYSEDVRHALLFLEGKSGDVVDELVARMDQAAIELRYEDAARYRDQIASLKRIQANQYVSSDSGDVDVVVGIKIHGVACVQVYFFRSGRNLGSKTFFPRVANDDDELLNAFLPQYYLRNDAARSQETSFIPPEILINSDVEDSELLAEALAGQAGHRVKVLRPVRGDRVRWIEMAVSNARRELDTRMAAKATAQARLQALQDRLELDELPRRMECFDISHSAGEATVASCVVFDRGGPLKADYRKFNIENVSAGDDYAAMRQALERRYTRLKQGEAQMPDILFVDGGKGQLTQAESVLKELQISEVLLVGVAKGADRRPGQETLFVAGKPAPLVLAPDDPALQLIQHIRDEAHRFAVAGHRARRGKARMTSVLEGIQGLGAKRRQQLLKQFGGMQEIARAGVEDLAAVRGISRQLAQRIYDTLHPDA